MQCPDRTPRVTLLSHVALVTKLDQVSQDTIGRHEPQRLREVAIDPAHDRIKGYGSSLDGVEHFSFAVSAMVDIAGDQGWQIRDLRFRAQVILAWGAALVSHRDCEDRR